LNSSFTITDDCRKVITNFKATNGSILFMDNVEYTGVASLDNREYTGVATLECVFCFQTPRDTFSVVEVSRQMEGCEGREVWAYEERGCLLDCEMTAR
jgi:hypothetical protein